VVGRKEDALCIDISPTSTPVPLLPPGAWEVDAARSTVGFEMRQGKHTRVRGCFRGLDADISCSSGGITSVIASVPVAGLDTGDRRRDERVLAADMLDVERHPVLFFSGLCPPAQTGGAMMVRGTMSIRGVARPLELLAQASPALASRNRTELRLRAHGALSRREFALAWDPVFAADGLPLDDRVAVKLDMRLIRYADPPA
jgi:polyisoprenoid-binding protein YceI